MPAMKELSNKEFLKKLRTILVSGLAKAGVEVEDYSTEPIKGTKLNRVILIADAFDNMNFSERHDLVWQIVGAVFTQDEQLRISMIMALGSKEAVGV
jgi:stress-induced morphogen